MSTAYERAHATWLLHQRETDRAAGRTPRALPAVECACSPKCRGAARAREFLGLRAEYAWAVPTAQAMTTILLCLNEYKIPGVVEVGAGGGYWARELDAFGVSVVAYDPEPVPSRWARKSWFPVQDGDHRMGAIHSERALMMIWPQAPWAQQAVDIYRVAGGKTVIYVGQEADRPPRLDGKPDVVVPLPRFDDVYDQLEIWDLR